MGCDKASLLSFDEGFFLLAFCARASFSCALAARLAAEAAVTWTYTGVYLNETIGICKFEDLVCRINSHTVLLKATKWNAHRSNIGSAGCECAPHRWSIGAGLAVFRARSPLQLPGRSYEKAEAIYGTSYMRIYLRWRAHLTRFIIALGWPLRVLLGLTGGGLPGFPLSAAAGVNGSLGTRNGCFLLC